jgi:hypothetical protein
MSFVRVRRDVGMFRALDNRTSAAVIIDGLRLNVVMLCIVMMYTAAVHG